MKPNEFVRKWIQGIKDITPTQQLHAEMIGIRGNIVGILFALVFLLFNGMWYFSIFLIFTVFLQVVSLIGVKQKYDNSIRMLEMLKPKKNITKVESEEILKKFQG